jgi:Fis family transcriptional regulator, factor for inversion stimulation protein
MSDELDSLVKRMYHGGILYHEAVREFQKAFIASALREHRGNLSKTAPRLGLHRNSLTRIVAQLGLQVSAFRSSRRRPPGSVSLPARHKVSRP